MQTGQNALQRRVGSLVWGGEQRLVAGDAAELDEFGGAVSLASGRALVGAFGESTARGAAYVFVGSGGAWAEEQKLVASDGVELDKFGYAVSLAGERALVGAYGAGGYRGTAYVFVKSGDGWIEEQKLVASDGAAGDNFGWSVSLTADRALIGAHGRDTGRGAAYVFVRNGSVWTEEEKLVAPDGTANDVFGYSVALAADPAADRALVGAPGRDNYRGDAHVFVRIGGAWAEEQKLVPRDGAELDQLGASVSIADHRAVVGAYWKGDLTGAAYVFTWGGVAQDPAWTEEQKLVASDGAEGDRFGGSVSLASDRVLIGAFGPGAAYVFARTGGAWGEEQRLVPSGVRYADLFGWSVSLAGDRALVGAAYTDQLRGAAYVYALGGENGDAGAVDAAADAIDAVDAMDREDVRAIDAGGPESGSCTRGDDCASGHCEDGICCDRTCAPSERCRVQLKVSGEDGTCGPAKAAALGASCKFDVQCTSGHCIGGDGVCGNTETASGDGGGCGCRAGSAPAHGAWGWTELALVLLLLFLRLRLRRPLGGSLRRCASARRWSALVLILSGVGFGACGDNQNGGTGARVDAPPDDPLLPARVRRLTNAEYAASVFALLGVDAWASVARFPRDATQKLGFTVNDAQLVSPVLAAALDSAAQEVIASARQIGQLDLLSPCDDPANDGEACASAFIRSFGAKAYRRPVTVEDVDPLLDLYRAVVAEGGSYGEGIEFVTRAIVQAPDFVYLTELGDSRAISAAGTATLTPHETASLLSYLVTAGPPDSALLGDIDAIVTPAGREHHLRRLLPNLDARNRLVRVVREWLGIDGIDEIDKDSNVYPSFAAHHNAMAAESVSFIDEVLGHGAGTLQELLGAEWTIIDASNGATDDEIAAYFIDYYGLGRDGTTGKGRTWLTGASGGTRVGILNQGAFLSRFATATGSNPVQRGVAVMRRVACLELRDPVELDIDVVPPVADPNVPKTTRELYAAHAADPVCNSCHQSIDNFGYAFEQYDGMGGFRANLDTATTVTGTGTDLDGDYADSEALARALAGSPTARACMARQMFRAAFGRGDASARGAEERFLAEWRQLPVDLQSNLIETLVALVRSDGFVTRSTGP